MKRLIAEGTLHHILVGVALLALGSPLYAAQQQADAEEITADTEAAATGMVTELPATLQRLPAGAKKAATAVAADGRARLAAAGMGQWKAIFDEPNGRIKTLYGARSEKFAQGGEAAARSFLSQAHTVFGLQQNLGELKTVRVDTTPERDHIRFQQTYNGVPVVGAHLIVHTSKENQVTMVQNGFVPDLQPANSMVIAGEAAQGIALDDLKATKESGILLSAPKGEQQLSLHDGKRLYAWKITIPSRKPYGLWVYEIDGESGKILYKKNEILSLTSGKGNVFKTNADYLINKVSSAPLKNMYKQGTTDDGYLFGLFANVFSDNYNDPYEPTYKFLYNPVAQPDWFHATQGYYAINTVRDWWLKTVVNKFAAGEVQNASNPFNWSTPIIVNAGDLCNAFYTPDISNGNGIPGMVFGNENSCATGAADLVLDWDVVRHEYTHAMADWFGFGSQFGGPVDYYGRAMGEGNADWYAYLVHPKDSRMATVAWDWSTAGYLRNLNNTRMYPRDVNLPAWGLPEEHYTGEIWGGYLYDLYRVLGSKAVQYIVQSYFYFDPSDGMMSGYPDFFDAILAGIVAEGDLTGKLTSSSKVWGLWASRGISGWLTPPYSHASNYFNTGHAGNDARYAIWWKFPATKSIATKGNLLKSNDDHEYVFESMYPNMTVTASVAGASGGLYGPILELYTDEGAKLPVTPVVSGAKATLTYKLQTPGKYIFRVSGQTATPARGYYDFKIALK
jgi:hypothetical protein